MRAFRVLSLGAVAALALLALSPAASAALAPEGTAVNHDPTPKAPNAVRGTYTTQILDNLYGFLLIVDLEIFELEIPPTGGRSASEIRSTAGPLRELFEATVRDTILTEAQRVLPDARVQLQEASFDYSATNLDADPYHPPLGVHAVIQALFTPQFFGLPATVQTPAGEIARAFLYSGGTYELQKQVRIPPGFDLRYVVSAPSFLQLNGPHAEAENLVVFHGDNFLGSTPSNLVLNFGIQLRPESVPANVVSGPLVRATFLVDDATPVWKQLVPFTNGNYLGYLDLYIEVHSLDAGLFASYPLPPTLRLEDVSGDLLRMAIREDLVARQDVTYFFQELIERSLQDGFGEDITVDMDWAAFDQSLNQPIGGAGGRTVEPLVVHATAVLPFESNKMFVSSTMGRLVGMTFGMSGDFELSNDGMWNSDYTVAYPENVHVNVRDSEDLTHSMNWGSREGFHVYLAQGQSTHVYVDGRSDFDLLVFLAGVLEVLLLGLAGYALLRRYQRTRFARAHPWAI